MLEGFLKTSALEHDAAWLSLTFLDSARLKLTELESDKIAGTTSSWRKVRMGPIAPPPEAATMIVGIHVAPQGETQDILGSASFGALWVGGLPRIVLTARTRASGGRNRGQNDGSFHVFVHDANAGVQPIEVTCLVSGVSAPQYRVQMTLEDAVGHLVARHTESFPTSRQSVGNLAHLSWQLPAETAGFLRVRARMEPLSLVQKAEDGRTDIRGNGPESDSLCATLSLAIIDRQSAATNSEFGWTLNPADIKLGLLPLGDLLPDCGIGSVKFPFICSPKPAGPPSQRVAGTTRPTATTETSPNAVAAPTKHLGEEPISPTSDLNADAPGILERGGEKGAGHIESLINFSDRLADGGVRLIGVLLPPGATAKPGMRTYDLLAVDSLAADPKTWYPSIEPILARLATDIRCWQIGDDRDPGWVGCTRLSSAVSRVKKAMDQIGQDVDVGLAWDLAAPLPIQAESQPAPWRFLTLPCNDTVTEAELAKRLDDTASARVSRWLAIEALPRTGHSTQDRIEHLANRMIVAKIHGAEGIFFAHPFDPDRGLIDRDGSPSELFFPWRTIALMLGGASFVGDIECAGGTRIHCFRSRGNYVGLLFGGPPQQEKVYLGDKLMCGDLWGRLTESPPSGSESKPSARRAAEFVSKASANSRPEQAPRGSDADHLPGSSPELPGNGSNAPFSAAVSTNVAGSGGLSGHADPLASSLEVQRLPLFLTGMDPAITQWQLNVAITPQSLPSVPLADVPVVLETKNVWTSTLAGRVRIAPPSNWRVDPPAAEFRIEPGAVWKLPLEVSLPRDVVAGRQTIALDFEIQADRLYRFTMYRAIEVALGDVTIDAHAQLTEQGDLEIRQTLGNQGRRAVSFRCDLAAPDRRRQSTEISLPPAAKNEYVYHLPDGRELLGKPLWLRAEEIGGPRVLNYRLEAAARR